MNGAFYLGPCTPHDIVVSAQGAHVPGRSGLTESPERLRQKRPFDEPLVDIELGDIKIERPDAPHAQRFIRITTIGIQENVNPDFVVQPDF